MLPVPGSRRWPAGRLISSNAERWRFLDTDTRLFVFRCDSRRMGGERSPKKGHPRRVLPAGGVVRPIAGRKPSSVPSPPSLTGARRRRGDHFSTLRRRRRRPSNQSIRRSGLPGFFRPDRPLPVSRNETCVTLHAMGFAMPRPSPTGRCALTAPFHPYLCASRSRAIGGVFSVALSLTRDRTGRWALPTIVSCRARTFLSGASRRRSGRHACDFIRMLSW